MTDVECENPAKVRVELALPRRLVLLLGAATVAALAGLRPDGGEGRNGARRRRKRRRRRRSEDPGQPAVALFPDLRTKAAKDLRFAQVDGVYVLRLTNTVWNAGEGRLELQGNPRPGQDDVDELYQNLYDAPTGGTMVRQIRVDGRIVYHPTHAHYHFADFASYRLLRRDEQGGYVPLGESTKTSFCIGDNAVETSGYPRQYVSCERVLQGLTPGWADIYTYDLPDQWIEIGPQPLADGEYAVESTADPRGLLDEGGSERETNNAATTYFTVEGGEIKNSRPTP